MWRYIVKRLITGIGIVFFGALIVYAVIRCLPSSYVETLARERASSPTSTKTYQEWLDQLNAIYGLNKGIILGFLSWLSNIFGPEGFGESWIYGIPVTEKFAEVIGISIFLNIFTLIVELVISVPLGIYAAKNQYSKADYTVTVLALLGVSLPSFFLATLLKYVFAVKLQWFDMYGLVGRNYQTLSDFGKLLDKGKHMVLPVITLTFLSIGGLMRFTRTNMLEVLNADYIRTARAKGLSEKTVVNKHAFRNTMIPLITYMSYLLPNMFTGSMIIEQLFQIPGIGYISYNCMLRGDIPFTMFYLTFILVLTQVSLIIADVMYAVVDPRVRIS